jgi:3-hydroxybutyryl-CoA dehydrogenase
MIGIIGSGTMGKGIAIEFAKNNEKVVLVSAQRHLSTKELLIEIDKVSNRYSDIDANAIHNNIILTNVFNDLANCDFIIEAVSENLVQKRDILKEVSYYLKDDVICASNTSSLSVEDIFKDIIDLSRVCGLHFFNPVHVMKLVELSYLNETSKEVIDIAKKLALSLDKEVILVKNSPGFIVNRLLIPMINEAAKIVEEGIASIEDIDKAMKYGANHPLGPLKLSDLIGNDITLNILYSLKDKLDLDISKLIKEKVENNYLGRKTKKGFYDYQK